MGMTEELTVITERVDDIPVLLAHMIKMGLPNLLDEHFPVHGNWQGLSLGWTSTVWLAHILSEGDHRLNQVQPWAEKRLETLRSCSGQSLDGLAWSDDRLAGVLTRLSDDQGWRAFETSLNRQTIRVYDLRPNCVRVDGTTVSSYGAVSEDGLLQFGHSKDHRPDLPQLKVMQAVLDPLGMPLATQVVSGEKADDPLYVPAIAQVRQGLARRDLLYVGDSKMLAVATRAFIQAGGDYYLGPLSKVQLPDEQLAAYLQPVWAKQVELMPVQRVREGKPPELIAEGYELIEVLTAEVEQQSLTWVERRLVIRSVQYAQAGEVALQARLTKAECALAELTQPKQGKRRLTALEPLQQAAEAIVKQYRVEVLLSFSYEEQVREWPVRRYRQRPTEVRVDRQVHLHVSRNEAAIEQAVAQLGWRVYATNQPADQLGLTQAVLAYRQEYLVEHGFGRLKGKPLSLSPMYLQDDDRATGLVRLLTIGLRVLTLLEFVVRRGLAQTQEKLTGLYAGNPKRATARPTAETLLDAFKEIHLTVVTIGQQVHRHLPPLSDLQQRILTQLGFSVDIYTNLAGNFSIPP
jgi:transposase